MGTSDLMQLVCPGLRGGSKLLVRITLHSRKIKILGVTGSLMVIRVGISPASCPHRSTKKTESLLAAEHGRKLKILKEKRCAATEEIKISLTCPEDHQSSILCECGSTWGSREFKEHRLAPASNDLANFNTMYMLLWFGGLFPSLPQPYQSSLPQPSQKVKRDQKSSL